MQQSVTKKAPVKVNLHLGIHPGRDERGYHRADSVMCALDLGDAVTVERLCAPAPQSAAQRGVALDMSEDVGIDYARNTAWLAAVRAKEALGDEHHYCVRVTKGVIPQSGLGGSSSDAASTIMAILELCGESRREELAVQVARSIGADVPFFLNPVPSYLDGAGDVLKESFGRLGDVPVYTAESAALQALTGYPLTRGVLCAMRRKPLLSVEALCGAARRVAVLENIVDATNLGAIFRSAAALGVDAVLLTPSCCDPLNRRAVRVSMGTVFQVPWTHIGDAPGDWPEAGLARLSALGYRSVALALTDRSVSIDDAILKAQPRLALVLGTEGDGLSPETIARCDFTARIPMAHGVDSLNVAAAGAVAFWELCRQI